jgi:hypothetical protein
MNKYLAFTVRLAAMVIPIIAFFTFLYLAGYRPLLTDSIGFDAKIRYVKEKKLKQIDLIAIGSSMTLNNLSSEVIKDSLNMSFFNLASWGLRIKDINHLAINYTPIYKPKYIIVVSSIADFNNDPLEVSINNYLNTSQYFKDHFEAYFYIKNFNSIAEIRSRKRELAKCLLVDTNDYSSLHFDKWGGVLLRMSKKSFSLKRWNDHEPFPTQSAPSQYQALISLSSFLKDQHIKFIFVQSPIKLQYVNTLASQQAVCNHFITCKNIVERFDGIYLNFHGIKEFSNDSLFVDQYHLSSTGAKLLTKKITHSLKGCLLP